MIRLAWLALAAAAGCTCRASEVTATPAPPAPSYPHPRTVTSAADVLCINEAVAVPARIARSGALSDEALRAALADDARLAAEAGAHWVRMNTATWPFHSWLEWRREPRTAARLDEVVALVQQAGLDPIVMLGPWPGNRTFAYTERYVPDDLAAYAAWVRQVVERYDGDGVADAPGLLRPVRTWEVDNEPDLHNGTPPKDAPARGDPADFETPAQYATVLVATAAAIRAAQPDAVVLNAGIFRAGTAPGRAYLAAVLAEPGAAAAVDALSIHAYFEEATPAGFLAALDNAEALAAGRPVFVTETGVPARRPGKRWVDEDYQARMVAFVIGESLARGVERVCWHTLADPPAGADASGYSTHSLYASAGQGLAEARTLKPSGRVYQRLARLLAEVPVAEVRRAAVSGGRAVQVGAAGWLVYDGEAVTVPLASGTVLGLLDGVEHPLDGPVAAPCLVRPPGS